MNVRTVCIILIALALGGVFAYIVFTQFFPNKSPKKNVIIISIETLRPDNMGVYGYKKDTTPHIDKWSRGAWVFTSVYTPIPVTFPSLSSLMSGMHPLSTGIVKNPSSNGRTLEENVQTLAEYLQKQGYETAAFIGNPALDQEISRLSQGFNKYYYISAWNSTSKGYDEYLNEPIKWVEKHNNKPLFLWVHLIDPHYPYEPKERFQCKFNSEYCSLINGTSFNDIEDIRKKNSFCSSDLMIDVRLTGLMKTLYDGEIATVDEMYGKLMHSFEEKGIDKNSLMILYGDHGEGFDHTMFFNHGGNVYNSQVRIPLIIKGIQDRNARYVSSLISSTDIMPTILDILDVDYSKERTDGKSFYSVFLSDQDKQIRRYEYFITPNMNKYAITDGKYKYIYNLDDACLYNNYQEELYDLLKDPGETTNILNSNQIIAANLKEELLRYMSKNKFDYSQSISSKESNALEQLKQLGY